MLRYNEKYWNDCIPDGQPISVPVSMTAKPPHGNSDFQRPHFTFSTPSYWRNDTRRSRLSRSMFGMRWTHSTSSACTRTRQSSWLYARNSTTLYGSNVRAPDILVSVSYNSQLYMFICFIHSYYNTFQYRTVQYPCCMFIHLCHQTWRFTTEDRTPDILSRPQMWSRNKNKRCFSDHLFYICSRRPQT